MKDIRRHTPRVLSRFLACIVSSLVALIFVCHASSLGQDNAGDVDLDIVGTLHLYPVLPEEGDDVVIGVLVANGGAKDARDVPVYFYEDDIHFEKVTIDIRAGDTVYVEANWTADSGDSYISAVVDPGREYDKEARDNEANAWVTVR